MLLLMGVGNIVFASSKHNQYEVLRREAKRQYSVTARASKLPIFDPPSVDEQAKYLNKIESRLEFYDLVGRGGKIFVVASAMLALATLAGLRAQRRLGSLQK